MVNVDMAAALTGDTESQLLKCANGAGAWSGRNYDDCVQRESLFGHGHPFFTQHLDVKANGLPCVADRFFNGMALGKTSR